MVKIRKYANCIERFLHGTNGQWFFNFAYSIGAAIVIWGALFKILHLPGGNLLLCIGMGTEIAMFILTAFDRPPKEYAWEEVFPVLDSKDPEDRPDFTSGAGITVAPGKYVASETAIAPEVPATPQPGMENSASLHESFVKMTEQMDRLYETTRALNEVSQTLLQSYKAITDNSENISQSALGYAGQMSDLNKNISGLNTIYEIQLKQVSGQLDCLDRVNRGLKDIRDMYEKSANESSRYCEETEKMARYMSQINSIYEKMIAAMTINMHNPLSGATASNPFSESAAQENTDRQ